MLIKIYEYIRYSDIYRKNRCIKIRFLYRYHCLYHVDLSIVSKRSMSVNY